MGNFNSSPVKPVTLNLIILFIRLFIGLTMLTHGLPKLEKLMNSDSIEFMNFLGLGPVITLVLVVIAEVICSVLIIFGLITRLACIPAIIAMAVAAFLVHGNDSFKEQELSIFYMAFYFVLLVLGSGKISLDALFVKKVSRY